MSKSKLIVIAILTVLLLSGSYIFFFKESPASKHLKASCEAIKSSPLSKGVDANDKLLQRLEFNLELAESADKEVTLDLSMYVNELRTYIELKKQSEASLLRNFQLDLTLGILGNQNSNEIVDGAVEDLQAQSKVDSAVLDQKLIRLKNTYKAFCQS